MRKALLVAVLLMLVGCTGVADRSDEARQVELSLNLLHGVDNASVRYVNDFTHGTFIDIGIRCDNATEAQIAAIANELNTMLGEDFADHDVSVMFSLGPNVSVTTGREVDPEAVARGAGEVRRIAAALTAPVKSIKLRPGEAGSSVRIDDASDPDQAVRAAVQTTGETADAIYVSGDRDKRGLRTWDITGRISLAQFDAHSQQISALPGNASFVKISDGQFDQVNIGLPDRAGAYEAVVSAIETLGAGREHPLRLLWGGPGTPPATTNHGGPAPSTSGRAGTGLTPPSRRTWCPKPPHCRNASGRSSTVGAEAPGAVISGLTR